MLNRYERVFGSGPTGIVASAALLVAAVFLKPFLPAGDLALPSALRWSVLIGTALGAAALAWWCVQVLPIHDRGRQLCEKGPYRLVRHPFYAAFLSLFDFGLALFLNHAVFLLWAILLHPLWHQIIRYEEGLLRRQFGDAYRAYAARTGRFVPHLSAFRRTQRRHLVLPLGGLVLAVALLCTCRTGLRPADGLASSRILETVREYVVARGGSSTAVPDNAEVKLSADGDHAVARFWLSQPTSKTGGCPLRVYLLRESSEWHVVGTKPGWSWWDHTKTRILSWLDSNL